MKIKNAYEKPVANGFLVTLTLGFANSPQTEEIIKENELDLFGGI